jgi:phosphoglucosamine mutase
VVGRDTRPSGPLLEAAAAAGFAAAGLDVELLGVVPTPTVAHVCASGGADLGLMISASHNPMPDNGLKLFGPGGHKLPDAVEDAVEAGLAAVSDRPTGTDVGTVRPPGPGAARPTSSTCSARSRRRSRAARRRRLRARVRPRRWPRALPPRRRRRRRGARRGDGSRINDGCGATHLEALQAAVREHGADVGIAHDGDADRCLATTAEADVVDGDRILAVCALGLRDRGLLPPAPSSPP